MCTKVRNFPSANYPPKTGYYFHALRGLCKVSHPNTFAEENIIIFNTLELVAMNASLKIISNKLEEYLNQHPHIAGVEPDWLQFFTRKLTVKDGNLFRIIPLTDILYLQSQSNYTLIVTQSKKYLVSKTMKHFESQGLHPYFIRVHKSYIINKMWIETLSKSDQCLFINNSTRIPVSKNCKVLNQKDIFCYQPQSTSGRYFKNDVPDYKI